VSFNYAQDVTVFFLYKIEECVLCQQTEAKFKTLKKSICFQLAYTYAKMTHASLCARNNSHHSI